MSIDRPTKAEVSAVMRSLRKRVTGEQSAECARARWAGVPKAERRRLAQRAAAASAKVRTAKAKARKRAAGRTA